MGTLRIRRGGNGVFETIDAEVARVTKTQVVIRMPTGSGTTYEKKFSRRSGYPIGEPHGFGFRSWFVDREALAKFNEAA